MVDGWTVAEKVPRLKRDWAGRHVRTRHALRNRLAQIPAGTVCEVERNHAGLHLVTTPCPCCGVQVYINRVPESSVILLAAREPPAPSPADGVETAPRVGDPPHSKDAS